MKQPFELKYIKRYIVLYIGVVVGMVLFYFLNGSSNPTQDVEKKVFSTAPIEKNIEVKTIEKQNSHGIKLLDKTY